MNKLKILFNQSLMISTGIIFVIGIQTFIRFLNGTYDSFSWPWYMPLSIVLVGILGSLPTLIIFYVEENKSKVKMHLGIVLHFILTGCIVSGCGFLFKWYTSWEEFWPILLMYVLIYLFVWVATLWISKTDEKKINEALKEIRDEE